MPPRHCKVCWSRTQLHLSSFCPAPASDHLGAMSLHRTPSTGSDPEKAHASLHEHAPQHSALRPADDLDVPPPDAVDFDDDPVRSCDRCGCLATHSEALCSVSVPRLFSLSWPAHSAVAYSCTSSSPCRQYTPLGALHASVDAHTHVHSNNIVNMAKTVGNFNVRTSSVGDWVLESDRRRCSEHDLCVRRHVRLPDVR